MLFLFLNRSIQPFDENILYPSVEKKHRMQKILEINDAESVIFFFFLIINIGYLFGPAKNDA